MELFPPPTDVYYTSLDDLMTSVNAHAKVQGYAVVKGRTKARNGVVFKANLACSRGATREPEGQGHRKASSTKRDCPFDIYAIHMKRPRPGRWQVIIRNGIHTCEASEPEGLRSHRRQAMTEEIKQDLKVHTGQVEQFLTGLRKQAREKGERCIINKKDLHNVKQELRNERLGPLNATQHVVRELERIGQWVSAKKQDDNGRITHLFFCHRESLKLLRHNWEVLLMDCTYKTNRYHLPLLLIQGITAMHTSFTVGYSFLESEKQEDYEWILGQLRLLLEVNNIPNPYIVVTDKEYALINALEAVYPMTANFICIWHCKRNVESKIKKKYPPADWVPDVAPKDQPDSDYKRCQRAWDAVIEAPTQQQYHTAWQAFKDTYNEDVPDLVNYIYDTWLSTCAEKLVLCYTNRLTHWGTRVTSRVEGGHAMLKKRLGSSKGDLRSVIDDITSLVTDQLDNYGIKVAEAKNGRNQRHRMPLFQHLNYRVTTYALTKIYKQYQMVLNQRNKPLGACVGGFRRTLGLPCAHEIDRFMRLGNQGAIPLEDVHRHWFYNPVRVLREDFLRLDDDGNEGDRYDHSKDPDSILAVEPRVKLNGKGRPSAATKRQRAIETSTRRDPSLFEHEEQEGKKAAQARVRASKKGKARAEPPPSTAPARLQESSWATPEEVEEMLAERDRIDQMILATRNRILQEQREENPEPIVQVPDSPPITADDRLGSPDPLAIPYLDPLDSVPLTQPLPPSFSPPSPPPPSRTTKSGRTVKNTAEAKRHELEQKLYGPKKKKESRPRGQTLEVATHKSPQKKRSKTNLRGE